MYSYNTDYGATPTTSTTTTTTKSSTPNQVCNTQFQSSSIFELYGPEHAFDNILFTNILNAEYGFIGSWGTYYKSSYNDPLPWVQVDYGCQVQVALVMFTTDISMSNIRVNVGHAPANYGQLSTNDICADITFLSTVFTVLTCGQVLQGRYVQIQRLNNTDSLGLAILELTVLFSDSPLHIVPRSKVVNSSASSAYNDDMETHGPKHLYDGSIFIYESSGTMYYYFCTGDSDTSPWVEIVLDSRWTLSR